MWEKVGDYLLKVSLVLLATLVLQPLLKPSSRLLALSGALLYLLTVGVGFVALKKGMMEEEDV
ncbi:hypothetical protein [Thermosulfurimonas sp. F29]|uniref:hypothetical protein n=1 Tax=Thermosulfurimonas sp. F29 TaxID=2867247 RepID=UPI001C82DADB|nr:hypothetical protein [Thermosulfurimonas sp. F29]MBX6422241.1 hypothetical protein [Thermosulfurimonas sp. F29]